MKPTSGKIVLVTLDSDTAERINKRRRDFWEYQRAHKIAGDYEDTGYIAHVGNTVLAGDVYPALVVRAWEGDLINVKIQLDGDDTYWATSLHEGTGPMQWHWPPRA